MSNNLFQTGKAAMDFARRMSTGLFKDIPQNKLCYQPMPGANHALWVMGHLATSDEFFLQELSKKPRSKFEAWKGIFFMGSKPMPRIADYPPVAEIMSQLDGGREDLLAWFASKSEAELLTPLSADMANFAPNLAALMSSIACHESMHAGQITVVRKSLGIKPLFA